MIRGRRESCRCVLVQDHKRAGGEARGEGPTSGISEGRVPGVVVRVEITQDKNVGVVDKIEEGIEVQGVLRRTGRRGRRIDVEDEGFDAIDEDGDALDFSSIVIEE